MYQHVHQLEQLNRTVNQYIPENLHPYCNVSSFNKGQLVLACNNAVWATQLRYSLPVLRDKLRQAEGLYQLRTIKIMIAAERAQPEPPTVRSKAISTCASQLIREQASTCTYKPLQEALNRLGNICGKSQE